ncbi:diguanylate cyclase [Aliirhizobium terrae]|uniref:GGDEF domain-containing protein n=1 Tax=Terrirhizobium terrae TaxID=2926709 RepID=UPI0025774535|nr:diguanylate cyclase [Rhizobium sp. CC-CFT758]WJH39558.1 diguanylate cyclase [Rhizobium sp. CC-CFT758]
MTTPVRKQQDKTLQAVSQHMARLDIAGLPRNYELFYEALAGVDVSLSREVAALSVAPRQGLLDEIGIRYQLPSFVASALPKSRDHDIRLLAGLRDKMATVAEQKKGFSKVLQAISRSLREDNGAGPRDILAEIEYLSVSLSDAVVAETELEAALLTGANQLLEAERDTSATRAVMLRDRMTGLPNHAAFVEELEELYSTEGHHDTALLLVAVADIAELADRFGEATAQRIVKKAAAVFRKTIKKNDFVARIGKGEFAFLFRDVSRESIKPIADRLAGAIADNLVFAASDGSNSVALMIGAAMKADAFSPQQLRLQAVAASDTAKANPRMRVAIHGQPVKS